MEIFSDASLSGWGVSYNGNRANGFWKKEEQVFYINYLELLASFFGIKCFAKNVYDGQILLRIDNTTAIAYLNKMGGVQFKHLNVLTKKIWQWCEKRNIWIFASYIASKSNAEADYESRKIKSNTEYELSAQNFSFIVDRFGQPEIDLFASRCNRKCKIFVSWKKDPEALTIDAFTLSWKPFYFYAFPPYSLILKVLQKIKFEGSRGIVIVPEWPTQPWFPLFKSMLISKVYRFKIDTNQFNYFDRRSVKFWSKTILAAGVLCGKHLK